LGKYLKEGHRKFGVPENVVLQKSPANGGTFWTVITYPSRTSWYGGVSYFVTTGLASWDIIKSMSHIIIWKKWLLSSSSPIIWPVLGLGGPGPLQKH